MQKTYFTHTPTLEVNNIYNMDCIEGMKLIPDNSIDLCITDPPFAIDFKAKRTNWNNLLEKIEDELIETLQF